jgi:putative ABC transport system permease protein
MSAIAHELAVEYPETNTNLGAVVVSLRDDFLGDLHLALTLLLAGVGCVLLIACANVAGLMMARATARQREIAIRAALGGSRARLMQQAIAESILLALAGAALGLLAAVSALPFLNRLVPLAMAAWTKPVIDWRVATFATLVSIVSALGFGLLGFAPVRVEITPALQQSGRSIRGARNSARRVLVMAEIALALPLLVASGLIMQTVWKLSHVELGFTTDHVLTARTVLSATKGSPYQHFEARTNFFTQVLERVQRIPGVVFVGYTSFLPLTNRGGTNGFVIEGRPPLKPGEFNDANFRLVSPEYFQTIGMHLHAGRRFNETDNNKAPRVAVINQAMARMYWRNEDPVGHRFRFGDQEGSPRAAWITIVGVVDDVRQMGLNLSGRAEMYFPYTQDLTDSAFFYPKDLAVRVESDPGNYADAIRKAVWSVDSQQSVSDVQPMSQLVTDELVSRDMQLKLFVAFALASLLLAAIGLYGLIAYTITQRTQEIGVRIALGARRGHILRLYLGEGARIIVIGLAVGCAGSIAVTRAMRGLVFGVAETNPLALFVSVAVLATVGTVAAYLPARHAASTEPMEALRAE